MMFPLAYLGSPAQWMLLIIACLVILGAKRLPELARLLGRSLGEFAKARREFESALHEASQEQGKNAPAAEKQQDDKQA